MLSHLKINRNGSMQVKIPTEDDGTPVRVMVEVWVTSINAVNDITSDMQIDIYISEMWRDSMLRLFVINH